MSKDEYFPDLTTTILIGWEDNYTTLRFSQFLYLILTESSSEKFFKYVSPKIIEEEPEDPQPKSKVTKIINY